MSIINAGRQQIKVTPRDSVPDEQIFNNAVENMKLISKDHWMNKSAANTETAYMVSAGPSLKKLLQQGFLNHKMFEPGTGNILFCVKHSLPLLRKFGYTPHFCIALDPRPIEGVSTHGKLRSELYGSADRRTKFLIASMAHPSIVKFLLSNGYDTYLWHSAANGLMDPKKGKPLLPEIRHFITGGTCSATRCVGMAHFMGFRRINLVGLDSNLASAPENPDEVDMTLVHETGSDKSKIKKYWQVAIKDSPRFWTTGELIAQIQDIEAFLGNELSDMEINILGTDKETSLLGALAEAVPNKTKMFKHYSKQTGVWQ